MADKLVSVNDDYDFPAPVAARQATLAVESIAGALANSEGAAALAVANLAGPNLTEGAKLIVHGHSYTPVPGFYVPQNTGEWSSKVAKLSGVTRVSHGVSATRMIENATAAVGTQLGTSAGNRSIAPGTQGILVLQSQMNDALSGPHTPAARSGFRHALRAYLAVATASKRVEASDAVATGPFNGSMSSTKASGGSYRFTQAPVMDPAYLEFRDISSSTGKIHILTIANEEPTDTGTLTVQVDGVDQGVEYVGKGQMQPFTSLVSGHGTYQYSPAVVTVQIPATGAHTVRVTRKEGGTKQTIYVDALLIPSENPPIVLVCVDPPVGPYTSEANQSAWAANSGPLEAIMREVVAEFPAARVVDLAPGWNPATMVALTTDNAKFHPNETGMEHIAGKILAGVRAEITKRLMPSIGL